MAEGGWLGAGAVGGGGGEVGARRWYHIKFPCYIRHLYGHSIGIHVLDFKWKSVNFDNLFRNKMFGLQLFAPIESFLVHVSGIRPW